MAIESKNGAALESATTVIGAGATFKGELLLEGPAEILGTIHGSVTSSNQVQIGQGANCNATVEAALIVVDGCVEGDLIANERLQLTGKAVVKGDISAAALIVADGATFVGHVAVGPEAVASAQSRRKAMARDGKLVIEPKPESRAFAADTSRAATMNGTANGDWSDKNANEPEWARA